MKWAPSMSFFFFFLTTISYQTRTREIIVEYTQWSWWFKQTDWFAILDFDVIFNALGGEYEA